MSGPRFDTTRYSLADLRALQEQMARDGFSFPKELEEQRAELILEEGEGEFLLPPTKHADEEPQSVVVNLGDEDT